MRTEKRKTGWYPETRAQGQRSVCVSVCVAMMSFKVSNIKHIYSL